jgi:hypothetical protein
LKKIILIIAFLFFLALPIANSQGSISTTPCQDYCDKNTSILHLKGTWNDKLKSCTYLSNDVCKYGCEDSPFASNVIACKQFPDLPPANETEKNNLLWDMIREMWYKQNYLYGSKPSMSVFGTDYYIGEYGKVWLQLLDASGKNVDNATCFLDVYYPFGNKYIERASMNFLDKGIYYYDLMIPDIVGIYPTTALCFYTTINQIETADSGYISTGINDINSYVQTQTKNNVYWKIDENLSGGQYRLDFGMNFTNIIQPALMTEIDITWSGKWNGGSDYLTIYIYNFTSSSWIALPNTIPDTSGSRIDIINSIATTNASNSGLLKNNETRIRITDTASADAASSKVQTDYLALNLVSLSNPSYIETRGASEMNVKTREISSRFSKIETLCGEILCEETSNCGDFVNYNEGSNYSENEILENITVTSLSSMNDTETYWEYWSPYSQDCTSIYYIKEYNGTGWEDVTSEAEMHTHPATENCHIKMPATMNIGEKREYIILMDNYMKWEVIWIKNVRDVVYSLIYPPCLLYAIKNNYTYTVPILDGTFVNGTDTELNGCHRFLDDIYWIDHYYNLSLNVTTVGEYTSYFTELRWYETALRQHNQLFNSEVSMEHYQFSIASNQSIAAINNSLMGKLNSIHNDLLSINQSITGEIRGANASIFNKLYSIQGDLSDIASRLINLTSLAEGANSSVMVKLYGIQAEISGLGSQIDSVNNSIMVKLYDVQNEISSVNNTALATNQSIMIKLYSLQGDLDNLLNNLTYQLANITNVTLNITGDLSTIANDVWELFFNRGTPPLAPSTDYYCDPSEPSILIKNITYNFVGQKYGGYYSKAEPIHCAYGCINRTMFNQQAYCDYDPTSKYAIAIVIIIIIIIIFYLIIR